MDDVSSTTSVASDLSSVEEIGTEVVAKKDDNDKEQNTHGLNNVKKTKIEYTVESDIEDCSDSESDNAGYNAKHINLKKICLMNLETRLRDQNGISFTNTNIGSTKNTGNLDGGMNSSTQIMQQSQRLRDACFIKLTS